MPVVIKANCGLKEDVNSLNCTMGFDDSSCGSRQHMSHPA